MHPFPTVVRRQRSDQDRESAWRRCWALVLGVLAVLVTTATPAAAQSENRFELGGFGGLHLFSDNNELGAADQVDGGDALRPTNSPGNSFIMGLRFAVTVHPLVAIEGEGGFLPSSVRNTDAELLALAYRLQALVHLGPVTTRLRPFALVGVGGMYGKASEPVLSRPDQDGSPRTGDSDNDFLFHGGAGVKYRMGESWGLRLDLRLLLPPSSASESVTTDFEGTAALYATFPRPPPPPPPPEDSDGDGIDDPDDGCPEEAEDTDGFQDSDGCPEADNDGDGVLDASDRCPLEAENKNAWQDDDGCPDTIPDSDGDGLDDLADKCPEAVEDVDGFEDSDGCAEPDNDKDGLLDADDKCPDEAGPNLNGGCPDTDRDGDTVVDRLDNCPDEAGKPEFQGCNREQWIAITGTRLTILKKVYFGSNAILIPRNAYPMLEEVARVLRAHPEIKRMRVEGHTDDRSTDAYNLNLSQRRADAVVDFLVKEGVARERLVAKGVGEAQPIADNKTVAGRGKNRRVEFVFIDEQGSDVIDTTTND